MHINLNATKKAQCTSSRHINLNCNINEICQCQKQIVIFSWHIHIKTPNHRSTNMVDQKLNF